MPSMFAGKVAGAAIAAPEESIPEASSQSVPTVAADAQHAASHHNPVYDVEAQRPSSQASAASRLPVLLGTSTAWTPDPSGRSTPQAGWESIDTPSSLTPLATYRSVDVTAPTTIESPQSPDRSLAAQPLLPNA